MIDVVKQLKLKHENEDGEDPLFNANALQEALDAGHRAFYFPHTSADGQPTTYRLQKRIILKSGVFLKGDGPISSVIYFVSDDDNRGFYIPNEVDVRRHTDHITIRDLMIRRKTPGNLFLHKSFQKSESRMSPKARQSQRLEFFDIRNVYFQAPRYDPAQSYTTVVHIQGGLGGVMDNVKIYGGALGLALERSSRALLQGIQVCSQNGTMANGILVRGGGGHFLNRVRLEGMYWHGYCVRFRDTRHCKVNLLSVEGNFESYQLWLNNCFDVRASQLGLGTPKDELRSHQKGREPELGTYGRFGVNIDKQCRKIRISGYRSKRFTKRRLGNPMPVKVESGADATIDIIKR